VTGDQRCGYCMTAATGITDSARWMLYPVAEAFTFGPVVVDQEHFVFCRGCAALVDRHDIPGLLSRRPEGTPTGPNDAAFLLRVLDSLGEPIALIDWVLDQQADRDHG